MTDQPGSQEGKNLARCVRWRWANPSQIVVLDTDGSPIRELSEWETLVFHYADGCTTASDIARDLERAHPTRTIADYLAEVNAALITLLHAPAAVVLKPERDGVDALFDLPFDPD